MLLSFNSIKQRDAIYKNRKMFSSNSFDAYNNRKSFTNSNRHYGGLATKNLCSLSIVFAALGGERIVFRLWWQFLFICHLLCGPYSMRYSKELNFNTSNCAIVF